MKSIFDQLGLAGVSFVAFILGLGLIALTPFDTFGAATSCLGGGFLCLIGAKETESPFNIILGVVGIGALIASGILYAQAV